MKAELILPGGDLERVKIAFEYGADAVYVGINKHSLRKAEVRFDVAEVGKATDYAHSIGKRLFVTFNIFAHNQHLEDIRKDMVEVAKLKPDAFIIADPGVMQIAKEVAPNVPIHVSTQANCTNIEDVKFWYSQGAKRIVLARELTLDEIKEIHEAVPEIELEIFVHGSMCISYSGRCLLSNYMTGREANLGECAQPCRWKYRVARMSNDEFRVSNETSTPKFNNSKNDSELEIQNSKFFLEEKMRPGEYFPIEENENGTYIMSSKDIALIEYLPEILAAGVTGLKVEGRNKSEYYLATVGYAYRHALDAIDHKSYTNKIKKELSTELKKTNNRDYTTGFLFGDAKGGETYEHRAPKKEWEYVGLINKQETDNNQHEIIVKNKIMVGDKLEILTPEKIYPDEVKSITDLNGNKLSEINPGRADQKAIIILSKSYPINSFLRKKVY